MQKTTHLRSLLIPMKHYQHLNEFEKMDEEEKEHVLFTREALIQKIKIKNIAAL